MGLKTEIETNSTHGVKTHLERQNDFPCHEMTALEIHSIVASCKYSNWQWIIKDKTQKNHRLLECHKAFCAKSGKQAKHSLETDAAAGSTSLELQTP